MAKKIEASTMDALACADACDKSASEIVEAHPAVAQQLRDASRLLRAMHSALAHVDCQHTITFVVTQAMIDSGREQREPGKYCMLCGILIPKQEKTSKKSQTAEEKGQCSK